MEIGIHYGLVLDRNRAAIDAALDDHMEVELTVTRKSNRTATRSIHFGGGHWAAQIATSSADREDLEAVEEVKAVAKGV